MKKLLFSLLLIAANFVVNAQCPQVLDQYQTAFDTGDHGTEQWQSFTPAVNGKLTQVNFTLNGIQTVTITLEVRVGTGTGGALLYTNNYSYFSTSNEQAMVIPYGSAPTLAAGTTYTLRFTSGTDFYTLKTSGDSYAGGSHYSIYGAVGEAWFKTFITPTNSPTIGVSGQTNPTCYGFSNGSITTNVAGGNGGNTYSWSPSGGTAQNASGLAANTYTVTVTDALGCIGTTSATLVSPAQVTMTDPPDQTVCAGNLTMVVNFSGATTYSWTNSAPSIGLGASGSGNIGAFTAVNAGTTPVVATITVTPSSGGCTGVVQTFTITVNPTPTANDPADQSLCAGSLTTALVYTSPVAGTVFNWNNSNTSIGLGATGSGTITPFTATNAGTTVQAGTITVTPIANGCSGPTQSTVITVNPIPTVVDPADQTLCAGAPSTAVNFSGTVAGTTFNWNNSNTSIGLGASGVGNIGSFTATNAGALPISGTVTVTPVFASCTGASQNFLITVNPTPTVNDPADQTLCAGATTTALSYSGPVAGTLFSWNNSNTTIGLTGSGSGNISSFTAVNAGTTVQAATITVTPSANGCTGTPQNTVITVNPIPTVADPTDQILCEGAASTAVNFSGTVAGTTFNWNNSNTSVGLGASGVGNISSFTALNGGTSPISGTVTVTPVYATCSGAVQTFDITVNPTPTVNASVDQTHCNGDASGAVTFTGTVAGTTFNWTNSAPSIGLSGTGVGNIGSFAVVNGGVSTVVASVSVTPTANSCNGATDVFTITVNPTPGVANPGDQTLCANNLTTPVNFAGTVAGTTYDWTNTETAVGLAASGTGNIGSFTATNAGVTTLVATISVTPQANGCSGIAEAFMITVNPLPTVGFSALADFCDNNTAYTLTEGTPTGGSYSGAGISGGVFDPGMAGSGTHTLTYTYTDVNSCTSLANQNVTVYAAPVVSFSAVTDFCEDAPVYTLVEGTPAGGIYSGPGISGSSFNPATAGAGTHTINYVYTDGNGCSNPAGQTITVNALPSMGFAPLTSVCLSLPPFALSSATPTGGTYSGPGVSGGVFDPAAAGVGTHTITYTYTDGVTGCTNQIQQNITVYNTPTIVANTTDTDLCDGESVTLTGSGAVSYVWDNSVTDGVAFTPAIGSVTYTVTGSDVNGCQGTDQVTVTVYGLPTVDAGTDQTICEGNTISLNGSGAVSYTWDNGATNGVVFAPAATTTYTVTGTDGNNCQNTDVITITVDPQPAMTVSADQYFCAGDVITLTASGAATYDWDSGAATTSSYTISPTATTTVQVIGTSGICLVADQVTLTLDDPALISAGTDAVVCLGFITYLNASGAMNYTWNGPGVDNVTEASHGFLVDTTAYYYLTAETANGCVYTDSVLITGSNAATCTIEPLTTFSPNGDAVNESWKIQGIESFPENHVTIINRWGDVVFDAVNYDNETVIWNGTLANGSEAPAGTYYFIVELTNGPSNTGWIQLLK